MQARANDVYDVGRRVMGGLLIGEAEQRIELAEPVILVATDLSPSDTAQLDPVMVKVLSSNRGGVRRILLFWLARWVFRPLSVLMV